MNAEHVEREDHGWAVEIPDHPGRTESPGFRRAKEALHKILAAIAAQPVTGVSIVAAISA
jgi:hypothetical protein